MLIDVTPEWSKVMVSLPEYIVKRKQEGDIQMLSDVDLYNDWIHWTGTGINDSELANWCLAYIQKLKQCDIYVLAEGVRIDKGINNQETHKPKYLWPAPEKEK